jgi:fibronectin type 3 domain-containing protein
MNAWAKRLSIAFICALLFGCGGGGTSNDDAFAVPPAPVSLAVEPGDSMNTVLWPAIAGATSYNLYWADTAPVAKQSARVITGAVSPYLHTGLTNGKLIYYAVTAVNAIGESELSTQIGATPVAPVPAPPGTVNATPSDGMVMIAWAPVSRADSYNLYWSNAAGLVPGGAGVTKIADIRAASYAHLSLANGTAYHYRVTAVNTGGESIASAEVAATPLPPAPGAPANLTATTGDAHVHLSWSSSLGATSYDVYWSKAPGIVPGADGVTKIAGVAATSYEPSGLANGDTYYYRVGAVGAGGESAPSAEVSVRPLPPAPPAPLGLTAIAPKDGTQGTVQWFDVTDYPSAAAPIQLGYNLYRGLEPGLATYYRDASRATKFANVTAPFVDVAVTEATTYYYVVTSFVPAIPDVESVPSGEASASTGHAGGSGGGRAGAGGHTTGYGNNLSVPLIFADDRGLAGAKLTGAWPGAGPFTAMPAFDFSTGLRPLSTGVMSTFPYYDSSTAVSIGGVIYHPQAAASTWQAEWRRNAAGAEIQVVLDWGDALSSRPHTANSMVRIEATLLQDETVITDPADTMRAYRMMRLAGSRSTEVQGTDGTSYASVLRTVFALNARLRIEKIADTAGVPDTVVFDKAVYESLGEGEDCGDHAGGSASTGGPPLKFGAELNGAGKLVYGSNLALQTVSLPADVSKVGRWRLTFVLDPTASVGGETVANHIRIVGTKDAKATVAADGRSSSLVLEVH